MCMVGDDDWWDWYGEHHPKARKPHRCGECRRWIQPGERYWTQGGLHDREFEWHKTCEQCTAASRWLEVVCEGWIFTRRQEDFGEHVVGEEKYIRSAPLTRLYRWMLADWRDRDGNLRSVEDVKAVTDHAIQRYRDKHRRAVAA